MKAYQRAPVTYDLQVSNVGATSLTNVVLTNRTPNNATTIQGDITSGGNCPGGVHDCGTGSLVTWPAFTLTPGETRTVSTVVQIGGAVNGTLIHDSAVATYAGAAAPRVATS